MDKSIVAADEIQRRNDSHQPSASKCSGSLVQINSIAIDINCAAMEEVSQNGPTEEIESPKHEHFSIRGFVSEMRKKDIKKCLPFASEGDDDDNMNLPPLSVPKFQWWQCSDCVPDIADQKSTLGMILASKSDAGTSSYQNAGEEKDDLLTLSLQTIGDEHGSRDSRDRDYSSPSDKLIVFTPNEGHNASANTRSIDGGTSFPCITEANPVPVSETHTNSADENPSAEPDNASSGSDDNIAFSALPHKRKPKLRSLADIIKEERNFTGERPKIKYSSTSTQIEADSNPQPQFEFSLDIAKGTKTPQRKRKLVLEEDRGPLEMNPLLSTAKKLKGLITEAENNNTCRRVLEISESESEKEGPMPLDLHLSALKTHQNKPRKQKPHEIIRKTRQPNSDNRTKEAPMMNSAHSANLQKYPFVAEASFGSMGHLGPFYNKIDSFSELSKGKRPEEGDHGSFMPPSKSGFGDCNIREKVALDLSLNSYMGVEMNSNNNQESSGKHTDIPDLNESFVEKTSVMEGPTLPEKRSLALHKNLFLQDMSASSSKETTREGKRPFGVSEDQQSYRNLNNNNSNNSNNNNSNNNVIERGGASEDIPMETVEFLAKNQWERALDNHSRKHLIPEGINCSFKGSHNIDGSINFPFASTRNGLGVGQGFLNFPPSKNCHLDINNSDKNLFRQFSPLAPSQQRTSLYSGPNNVVSGLRPSEGADLLWPPRRKNVTFDLTGAQNRSSLQDQSFKGNVSYTKGEGKRAMNDESLVREGKNGPGRKSVRSMDAYSNDTILAMQLLSFEDQGIVSGSSFKVGPNNFLDRQFSPCSHHPRLNKNDNQNDPFASSSFFAQNGHIKDFPALLNGARYSGDSSKKSFSQAQISLPEENSKATESAGPSNLANRPSGDDLTLGPCTLNRNPADFSFPDATNEYTISARDLKPKKRTSSSKERGRPVNAEIPKRHRVRKEKDPARKERSRK